MENIIIINFSEELVYPAEIFRKRILDRSDINVYFNNEYESKFGACDRIYNIYLKTDESFEKDYKIETCDFQTIITGSSFINLIGGIGKFLHNTKYYKDYIVPCEKNYSVKAECEYRCVYFANHFYNYYQLASDESIKTYMEDIALWGYNNIASILMPTINLFGKDDKNVDWFVKCAKRIYDTAKALGMKYTGVSINNKDFKNQNPDIIAVPPVDPYGSRGSLGELICPNKPGAIEYIKDLYNWIFDKLAFEEIDYMVICSYDEGGCGCEKCYPWVPRGLMKIYNELKVDINKRYPNIKYILDLWRMVDDEKQEWEEIVDYIKKHPNDFEYVNINTELKFEKYPLRNHIPGK
ncbi:MAG: hypothetical protein KBT47_03735, partial [Armatimonadetes bacterium]|nr:hypothetical protein [Candidatus Hippobium faecium]